MGVWSVVAVMGRWCTNGGDEECGVVGKVTPGSEWEDGAVCVGVWRLCTMVGG